MTRTAFNTTLGKQVAILPVENGLKITQGPNPAKDGFIPSNNYTWSHKGYHAIDHCDSAEINFYAPFDMMCVMHKYFGNVCFTFFTSLEEVVCVSESLPIYVSMVCIHGGDPDIVGEDENGNSVTKLNVGVIIRQGNKCYEWGNEGDYSTGEHIHFEVMKGSLPKNFNYSNYMKSYEQKRADDTTFLADGFINGTYAEDIFFKLPTDTVEFTGSGLEWSGHINFETYVPEPFNPSNKPDGWYKHNGVWYYVENHACVTGWKKIGSSWYCFEADGKMKTGWVAYGNDWYWLSPGSGVMQINEFVDNERFYVGSDGKMLRSGWTLINGEYYYFKDKERDTAAKFSPFADGEKVTNV